MDYAIIANGVCKSFRHHQVLKNVNLSVPRGDTIGLVGNNGSGKSVLLKCLCGLLIPKSGTIIINGKQLGRDMSFIPEIGAVIESPGFLPQRSGYDNLKSLWALNKRTEKDAIARSMERVKLDPREKKAVGKYSLGMRQRLGIAQALMENPDILILDEPFNGLDRYGVREMYDLLKSLQDMSLTAVIASHNPLDIAELCSTVYEIDQGEIHKLETLR